MAPDIRCGNLLTFLTSGALLLTATAAYSASNTATGWFEDAGPSLTTLGATDTILADLDGDGDLDGVVAYGFVVNGSVASPVPNQVLINTNGFLMPGASFGMEVTESLAAGDVDGDGDVDVVAGNGALPGQAPSSDRIWLNDGTGKFSPGADLSVGENSVVRLVDMDGDGDLDLISADNESTVTLRLNQGGIQNGTEGDFASVSTVTVQTGTISDLAVGSLVGTSAPDIYVATSGGDDVILENVSGGALTDLGLRIPGPDHTAVALGDVDGDSDIDAVVASALTAAEGGLRVWFNDNGAFSTTEQLFERSENTDIALADLDGDGDLDALVGERSFGSAGGNVWLNSGSGLFRHSGQCFGYQRSLSGISLGDVDGDGALDALAAGAPVLDIDGVTPIPGQPGTTVWRNGLPAGLRYCCPVEFVNELSLLGKIAGVRRSIVPILADLPLLYRIRDEFMLGRSSGDRLVGQYERFGSEIVEIFLIDSSFQQQAGFALAQWQWALQALADGDGDTAVVSSSMILALDQFLSELSMRGSAAASQMIADERLRLPPLSSLVGLSMVEFTDRTMGFPPLFRDGFEN